MLSKYSAKIPEDLQLEILKYSKGGTWYDDWRPYCGTCSTMRRMDRMPYGFKCVCCSNMIGWDLQRLDDSPLNKEVNNVDTAWTQKEIVDFIRSVGRKDTATLIDGDFFSLDKTVIEDSLEKVLKLRYSEFFVGVSDEWLIVQYELPGSGDIGKRVISLTVKDFKEAKVKNNQWCIGQHTFEFYKRSF